jgi:hypothetical protein
MIVIAFIIYMALGLCATRKFQKDLERDHPQFRPVSGHAPSAPPPQPPTNPNYPKAIWKLPQPLFIIEFSISILSHRLTPRRTKMIKNRHRLKIQNGLCHWFNSSRREKRVPYHEGLYPIHMAEWLKRYLQFIGLSSNPGSNLKLSNSMKIFAYLYFGL